MLPLKIIKSSLISLSLSLPNFESMKIQSKSPPNGEVLAPLIYSQGHHNGGDFHLENLISETLEIALELLEILGTYLIHFERADKKEEDPSDSACV